MSMVEAGTTSPPPQAIKSNPLFEARKQIFPQSVHGTFRRIKWGILVVSLAIYYFLPFIRWERGPNEPTQAVLVDLARFRFYFFFIEIWPQEVYYITGLLILAAFALFLTNALAGRAWCGYLCPQTVWTDLFLLVERLTEGDRRERMRKEAGPWTLERVTEKVLKHFFWQMIAWWTGGVWVLYFADAPTLVRELVTFSASPIVYGWIAILTGTTYLLAGFMREQVCLYMCPWPRIQAALTDENALNVTYRTDIGEPRMSFKKAAAAKAKHEPAGDCVDCNQCVVVCPTGIDIREGLQMGCIQCGLCIDACANVMTKLDRPSRLIGYDTDVNLERRAQGKPEVFRPVRPRTVLYMGLIVLTGGIMLVSLLTRGDSGLSAIHDRNPLYVTLSDGSIRNAFTLRFVNKQAEPRTFTLSVVGLPDATLDIVGVPRDAQGRQTVSVAPDGTLEVRATVTRRLGDTGKESTPVVFTATDAFGKTALAKDFFRAPLDEGDRHETEGERHEHRL